MASRRRQRRATAASILGLAREPPPPRLARSSSRKSAFGAVLNLTRSVSAIVFLETNGYTIDLADTDFPGRLVVAALEDRMSEDDFADVVRLRTVELKDG
jgi:hypothetical protein